MYEKTTTTTTKNLHFYTFLAHNRKCSQRVPFLSFFLSFFLSVDARRSAPSNDDNAGGEEGEGGGGGGGGGG